MKENNTDAAQESQLSLTNFKDTTLETAAKEALGQQSPSDGIDDRIALFAAKHLEQQQQRNAWRILRWSASAAAAVVLLAFGVWQLVPVNETTQVQQPSPIAAPAIANVEAIVGFAQEGENAELASNDATKEERIRQLARRLIQLEGLDYSDEFTLPEAEEPLEPHSTGLLLHKTPVLQT